MNKLYMIGSVFIGIGALFIYHAGVRDAKNELADDTWTEAIKDADNSPLGLVDDVRVEHHGIGAASDSA